MKAPTFIFSGVGALGICVGILCTMFSSEPVAAAAWTGVAVALFLGLSWVVPAYFTRNLSGEVFMLSTMGMIPFRLMIALGAVGFSIVVLDASPAYTFGFLMFYFIPVLVAEIWALHKMDKGGA